MSRRLTQGKRPWALADAWGDAKLEVPGAERGESTDAPPDGPASYRNVFSGEVLQGGAALALRDVFATFPVAWLLAT